MSDRIQELVQSVKDKANALHEKVQVERSKNQDLENNLLKLKEELKEKETEVSRLKGEIQEYETKLKTQNLVNVESASGEKVSDAEIDELVREIDYCIAQLKK